MPSFRQERLVRPRDQLGPHAQEDIDGQSPLLVSYRELPAAPSVLVQPNQPRRLARSYSQLRYRADRQAIQDLPVAFIPVAGRVVDPDFPDAMSVEQLIRQGHKLAPIHGHALIALPSSVSREWQPGGTLDDIVPESWAPVSEAPLQRGSHIPLYQIYQGRVQRLNEGLQLIRVLQSSGPVDVVRQERLDAIVEVTSLHDPDCV